MDKKFKFLKVGGLGAAVAAMAPGMAQAAIDVSDVVTGIGEANAPIVAIGGAVLLVLVGVKVFKWVRQAM